MKAEIKKPHAETSQSKPEIKVYYSRSDAKLRPVRPLLEARTGSYGLIPKAKRDSKTPHDNYLLTRNGLLGIGIVMEGAASMPWLSQLEGMLQTAATLAVEAGLARTKDKLDDMVKLFASDIPAPRYLMREAKMIAKAQEQVILSTEWLNTADLSELAGFKSTNKSSGPTKWKSSHKIFCVKYQGEELYPIYALDKNNNFRPLDGLQAILKLFAGRKEGWGVAYWFAGANSFLGGRRPQDLLESDPGLVLQAAQDELEGVTHG